MPPSIHPPQPSQDQPEIPCGSEVLHAPAGHDIQKGQLLRVPKGQSTMYERLLLGPMMQLVPPPLPSIQGKAEGQYCSKAHDQRGQK